MASKTTKGRKNTRTKRKTGAKAKGSSAKNTELTGEITILITLALCILLVLSNFGIGWNCGGGSFFCAFWIVWIHGICASFFDFCGSGFLYIK